MNHAGAVDGVDSDFRLFGVAAAVSFDSVSNQGVFCISGSGTQASTCPVGSAISSRVTTSNVRQFDVVSTSIGRGGQVGSRR